MTLPVSTALALCLITSPELTPDGVNHLSHLSPVVVCLAVSLDLAGPGEVPWLIEDSQRDPGKVIEEVRRRYADLQDTPPTWDVNRFPYVETTRHARNLNRAYRSVLVEWRALCPERAADTDVVIGEVDWLYRVWDLVDDAGIEWYSVPARRKALAELRSLIGEADFYAGILPDPIPRWRCQRGD